ncbi:uncharacterized protein BJX67DRAFT_386444 [Aspergillus lucknowensis]|uniref:Uncharacterized protein n=1 Tax=Aspergillus lucknowensis TaxID=176173 RepID=A0ABR4L637_9EURO
MDALTTCLRLIRIFEDDSNRISLEQELRSAAEYFQGHAPPAKQPVRWIGKDDELPCPFPFITTCLVVGTSYDPQAPHISIAHEEPYWMGYNQGDNNDGITVLDITRLDKVQYCFVNFVDYDEREMKTELDTPLTGLGYLQGYYDVGDEILHTLLQP